ncbi:MAG: hypothetical protein LBS25_04050 [Candidatus Symbiothrix sp.]|jgi:hypothetical protein|nr:hypothetical protein [Candidatus Symbiothrix sp.]
MKRTTLLTIVICMAISTFADRRTLKERTETWLQRDNTETTAGLRGEGDAPAVGEEDPTPTPAISPVGESLGILLVGSALYGANIFRRKKQ